MTPELAARLDRARRTAEDDRLTAALQRFRLSVGEVQRLAR